MTTSDAAIETVDHRRATLAALPPRARFTAAQRRMAREYAVERYRQHCSVRSIADELGRAYGTVYRLLVEAGVPMRPRGGQQVP